MRGKGIVFALVAVYACAHFATSRLPWDVAQSPIRGSDLSSYYTAARLVRAGRASSLYEVAPGDTILGDATSGPYRETGEAAGIERQHYYIYPPFFALLFLPLGALSFGAAMNVWLALDLLLLAAFLAMSIRGRADTTGPEAAFAVAVCCFEFLPMIWAMAVGQTSLLVLVLLTGTLLAWRRGSDAAAGALLGLAVAIKLTPVLLGVFFWWRGRRTTAIVSCAVFLLTQAISIAALGWEPHRAFFLDVVPSMAAGTSYFLNQSLTGFFDRLMTGDDVREVAVAASPAARAISLLAGALAVAFTAWRLRRVVTASPPADELQFGAVILLTLLVSPISWTHHYLLAVLPILAVASSLLRESRPPVWAAAALGLAWLLIARKPHPDLFLTGPARLLNSGALAGSLLLLFLCLRALAPPPGAPGVNEPGRTA
ncbi:MAG TPA: glycosyltransferase family 87 protein [Verrucomicrobiae bacterium]|nr:glycosyltransferase family 87 protein [Verrucomicrobiae bacterium]